MSEIKPIIESWKITNNSTISVNIVDIPSLPTIKPGQTIEALSYTTSVILSNSINFRNYLKNGILSSTGYFHTHNHNDTQQLQGGKINEYYHLNTEEHIRITDFFKNTDITSAEAEILTNRSNADQLHKHENKTSLGDLEDVLISEPLEDGQVLMFNKSLNKWINSDISAISSSSSKSSMSSSSSSESSGSSSNSSSSRSSSESSSSSSTL